MNNKYLFSRRRSRRTRRTRGICDQRLSDKIAINTREFREGSNYYSLKQARKVAYLQVSKMYPRCKRYLERKSMKYYSKKK